ncbi:tetratricopeptide repeat protein [Allokutzneria multivorans]|uniref:tetratricopeptide repeat protein n=1 Tax=Allokutzneria multivorans TaxID=1142134 RepID=UPI0031EF9692
MSGDVTNSNSGDGHGAVPRALAPPRREFVNRVESRQRMLDEVISARSGKEQRLARVMVYGPDSCGRMEMINKFAADQEESFFPDGSILVEYGGPNAVGSVDAAVRNALIDLGEPVGELTSFAQKRTRLRTILRTRDVLMVLRGVTTRAQVDPFIVEQSGSALVVISARTIGALETDGFQPILVAGLDNVHALELFRRLTRTASSTVEEKVVLACGGSPLLIGLLAAQIVERPHRAERITRRFVELGPMALEGDVMEKMGTRLDVLLSTLEPRTAAAYVKLGLHPGARFDFEAARALLGLSTEDTEDVLDELVQFHLLNGDDDGYRFDPTVFWHARARAARELTDDTEIAQRIVEHYLDFTVHRDAQLSSRPRIGPRYREPVALAGPEKRKVLLAELEDKRETLLRVVLLAEKHGFDDLVWQFCEALWGLYHLHGHYEDWRRTHEIGFAVAKEPIVKMRMASQLGSVYFALGEWARAEKLFAASAESARQVPGPAGHIGEQSAFEWRGKICFRLGRYDEAAAFYDASEAAARLAPEAEQPRMLALLELQRARLRLKQTQFEAALTHAASAGEFFDGSTESDNKAKVLLVRGMALAGLRRDQEAEEALFAAVAIFAAEGSMRSELDTVLALREVAERLAHKDIVKECDTAVQRLRLALGL